MFSKARYGGVYILTFTLGSVDLAFSPILSSFFSFFHFERTNLSLIWNLSGRLGWLASESQGSPYPLLPSAKMCTIIPGFFV